MLAGYQLTCGHCQTKTVLTHQIVTEIETAGVYSCECEAKLFPTDRDEEYGLFKAAKETTSAEKESANSQLFLASFFGIGFLVFIVSIEAYAVMWMAAAIIGWGLNHRPTHSCIIDIDFTVGSVPESHTVDPA
ncbi:hypothetical protein L4C36_22940 [Photobacterium japonica]|uniref:hypothetical protein n=1 Tax=Photobacterium japonica TaxID=2910235 RepID=UPI003D10EE1C